MEVNTKRVIFKNITERFMMHARARSKCRLLDLDVLEAVYVAKLQPELCRLKKFVRILALFLSYCTFRSTETWSDPWN